MRAPACSKAASAWNAPSPAPVSTSTSTPPFPRAAAASGVSATRRSPGKISLGTATFMGLPSWAHGAIASGYRSGTRSPSPRSQLVGGAPTAAIPGLRFSRGAYPVSAGVRAADVVLELVDGLLLVGDDPLDQVADREDAHQLVVFDHGKVSHPFLGHEGHALVDSVLWRHRDDRTAHDLGDEHLLGGSARKDDLARVVPLGDHPDEPLFLDDQQCPHAPFGHLLNGVVDGGVWWQRPDASPFVLDHARNRVNHGGGPQRCEARRSAPNPRDCPAPDGSKSGKWLCSSFLRRPYAGGGGPVKYEWTKPRS